MDDHVRVIDKKISQFKTYLRLYSFDEIVSLCQKYKLTLIYAFGDMNRKVPFNEENYSRMVLVFKN